MAPVNCRKRSRSPTKDLVQLEALYSMNILCKFMLRLLHDESFSSACAVLDDEEEATIGCMLGKVLGSPPQFNLLQCRSESSCYRCRLTVCLH